VLRDITLQIPVGETIALVGPNGCGKSTLGNLLLRFFDPTQGSVRIDGVDLRDMRMRDLRRQIGLVTQDAFLFNDTIEANIRFGRPGATRDEIEAVAKRAFAHDFILEQLPDGYETVVGESACRLSGGQRQRIALARVILKDPSILILDEATSQIDLKSEHQIHKVLAQFIKDRTTIIITHRQTILELTDRVVVMENGRIVDVGSHAELMARSHAFQRLSLHSKLSA
jgi:ATP-binding cassette subfamily B protein/subfamily B ATP-binding cassette protein MsbA